MAAWLVVSTPLNMELISRICVRSQGVLGSVRGQYSKKPGCWTSAVSKESIWRRLDESRRFWLSKL